MPTVDEHLEQALREYNEKVNALEDGGSPQELLDARTYTADASCP